MPRALETRERIVWAKNDAATTVCPKSFITPQSMAWLEEYLVRRKLGEKGLDGLGAREVEAFVIMEHELTKANGSAGASNLNNAPAPRRRHA
jgi:hypothetical protein